MNELKFDVQRKEEIVKKVELAQSTNDIIVNILQNYLTVKEYNNLINELKASFHIDFMETDEDEILPMWMEFDEDGFPTDNLVDEVTLKEFQSVITDYIKYLEYE